MYSVRNTISGSWFDVVPLHWLLVRDYLYRPAAMTAR
jgi:hypothetical protein